MVTWPMTSRDHESSSRDPNTLKSNISRITSSPWARSWLFLAVRAGKHNFSTQHHCDKKAVLSQKWPRDARCRSWAVAEIWPFEIIQDGGGRHLGFLRTVNSAVRSTVPENPTLEPNMKWIGSPVAEIYGHWPFVYLGAYGTPILGWRGGRRRSAMAPLERAMVFSYRLSIVTVALFCTIRPQFAYRMSPTLKSTGGGWLWAQI